MDLLYPETPCLLLHHSQMYQLALLVLAGYHKASVCVLVSPQGLQGDLLELRWMGGLESGGGTGRGGWGLELANHLTQHGLSHAWCNTAGHLRCHECMDTLSCICVLDGRTQACIC